MVTPQNGSRVAIAELLGGTATDSKNKALKFQQEKDTSIPTFTAKGKDKQVYGFSLADIVATVTVSPETDLKALRKKGFPVAKEDAKRIDQEIKDEKKAARDQKKAARKKAVADGTMTEAQAETEEKAEEEAEKEEKEAEEGKEETTTTEDANPTLKPEEKSTGRRAR